MRPSVLVILLALTAVWTLAAPAAEPPAGQSPPISQEGVELFEKHIRPVLARYCYECHSTQAKKIKGKLLLDSRGGMVKGGENGRVIVPGDPEVSRLVTAIRWSDADLQMPPRQKLSAQQIEKFEQWVRMGAPDPRDDAAATSKVATINIETGRKWWAFQSVAEISGPAVRQSAWPKKKIDNFVLAQLEAKQLAPSPEADPRTLIQRAYLDLTGLRPTFEQVEAFAKDSSPAAYEKVVESLLASPQYGERWGRYWLDVARYGEDNPTTEATNPPYPFAWRYRDWVIQAINQDVPYDRFVKLQLAADLMSGVPRRDLAALTFLGAGPVYHKDGRLSRDVIETLYTDDWDERVDTVSRGILGLTVACARCHDHKFDPISTRDYYSLAGVFASTVAAPRPIAEVDAQTETRFMAAAQRIFYLSYVANLLRTEPGSKPREARVKVERCVVEMDKTLEEMSFLSEKHPEMYVYLAKLATRPDSYDGKPRPRPASRPADTQPAVAGGQGQGQQFGRRGRGRGASVEPFVNAVYDAGLWVNGSDADLTMIDVKPGQPHDMNILPGGNVSKPGALVQRGFIAVLAKSDPAFHNGSGRLELAERIFTDAAPLAARVIVNRVWAWHFGKPLVATPSDFGAQGERPTHPQLLDDLAARFVKNEWSLKWLHREIMLSASYRQASQPRKDALKLDPANRLLWRMNPRRLDVEAYRDNLLQAAGMLDRGVGGPSMDLDQQENRRRTVYARVSRGRLNPLLQLYDFPEATMHSPSRETTTTPLQQLFAMNSPFMQEQAAALVKGVEKEPDATAKVRAMYRKVLARDPSEAELVRAATYLTSGTPAEFAHGLLYMNEVIFWP
ncbi:MAG TPA: PSD1 and planctomycete cytochrome C domain-containing protein [Tepidisphaeraceae bacterium]|nr:PSD1 and planctomycete cytochrome C domain-containing protein [Tepidisphaeraceae bacterium]